MSTAVEIPPGISERRVVRGGLVVGAGLLTGQALGFIRHATIAYLLGTGPQADALAVAFAPVDFWWAVLATTVIFGFGPLLAAGERTRGPGFGDLRRTVVLAALLSTVVFQVFAPQIVRLLAPGLPPETARLAAQLLRVTSLAVPAVAWSTLFTALLYSERRFAFPAFHQSMVNLCVIVFAVALSSHGAWGFAAGYAVGGWLQLAAARAFARRSLAHRGASEGRVGLETLLAGPAPVLCYAGLIGLNPIVTRALASTHGPGSTAAFDYCLKLVGVPLALLVVPLSASLLSEIAPFRLLQDRRAALTAIVRVAAITALAATGIVAVMEAVGPWVVGLLFERGQFGAASTATVSAVLFGFFPVLVAWSVLDVIARSFFSLGRPWTPIAAAGLALAVNVIVSAWMPEGAVRGTGLGAVLGFLSAALLMTAVLVRNRQSHGTEPAS
jgi:putative peptidoglycan lipid II flippase